MIILLGTFFNAKLPTRSPSGASQVGSFLMTNSIVSEVVKSEFLKLTLL